MSNGSDRIVPVSNLFDDYRDLPEILSGGWKIHRRVGFRFGVRRCRLQSGIGSVSGSARLFCAGNTRGSDHSDLLCQSKFFCGPAVSLPACGLVDVG